jgi:H+/Cl- antiporter ClcA
MGAGYEAIDQAMHAQFGWNILLLLALFKIVATTLSFSSGTPGGMFAPTLFIGAMLGAAVGSFENHLLPSPHRIDRLLCAGGDGRALCSISARSAYLGLHGAGGERELLHHPSR